MSLCPRKLQFFAFKSIVDSHPDFPAVAEARDIESSGLSEDCFNLARSWLENCVSTHTTCASRHKSRLPTRLLDVGSSTSSPRLYIPNDKEEAGYIALSHCWGTSPPLQTTESNLEAMCHGIQFSELPRNFQDAVTVTRVFGVRYLWIDSLCILQDSKDDWALESAQMGDIYSNALFVLAAAAGDGCKSGFLAGSRRKERVVITSDVDSKTEFSVRPIPKLMDPYGSHFRHSDQRSKLSTRGWAFQEQLLARRILSYSDEEMSWECLEESFCECQTPASQNSKSITARRLISKSSASSLERESFYPIWTSFVQEYTLRQLSFPSDRLTAFSGIVARLQSSTTGRYLAGVWTNYLPHGLAWLVGTNSKLYQYGGFDFIFTSKHQKGTYAPSWSWASVTGPITFWSVTATNEPSWDISVVAIRFKTGEVNGDVSPAEVALELSGRLLKIKIGGPKFKDRINDNPPLFKVLFPSSQMFGFYANPDIFDEDYYLFGEEHYLLSLFHYTDDNRPQDHSEFHPSAAAVALVLRSVPGHEERGCYERVACVLLTNEDFPLYLDHSEETRFTLV